MQTRKIAASADFVRQCFVLLAGERRMFTVFMVLSVLGALTEGIGISLLVPILDSPNSSNGGFANVPVLGDVAALFPDMSPNQRIQAVVVVLACVLVLRNVLQYTIEVLGATVPLRLERELNLRSYAALMSVEMAYIQGNEYGTLINGVGGWSQRVTVMLTNMAGLIANAMTVSAYAIMMLLISWRLTLLALAFLIVMSFVLKFLTTTALHRMAERLNSATSRLNQIVMESITGMKIVRLSAAEEFMQRNYTTALNEANASSRTFAKLQALSGPTLGTAAGLFICALLFGTATMHADETTTSWVAPVLLFLFLLFRLVGPVSSMNAARTRIVGSLHAFDLLTAFYRDTQNRRQQNGSQRVAPLRQSIVFDRVTFTHATAQKPALSDVSITVDRGSTVAIVGPSGAGKSTLINLLTRLYNPQSGRILIDGVDLRELDVHDWRRHVAVVSQDIFIFNDTISNNIAFGFEDASDGRIREAAKLAAASEFIEQLSQGYDTVIGDRGTRLSGGQQQRIAIARAIFSDPDLLILDEATSSLDTLTEHAIQTALAQISKNRTLLVIAHRLSTIRKANKVVVIKDGVVMEEGTHRELLDRKGIYWDMVEHQRLDLIDDDAPGREERALT